MAVSELAIERALGAVLDTDLKRSIVELGMLDGIQITGARAAIALTLPSPIYRDRDELRARVVDAAKKAGAAEVDVSFKVETARRTVLADDPCPDVANIVLVMSGKGGVGKSTVATNLALSLTRAGARVGLLDADMYGPSIPTMLGVNGRPVSADGKKFLPLERFGLKLMSLGFMLEDSRQAVVWRGPMLQSALLQFLKDVEWGPLDYLVLDLPPGTGDIALTISQKLRTTGAVVVTTPQEVALQDVYKSVSMAQKVGIPILGVIENESYFVCDGCSKRHELFGSGGGQAIADFAEAPLLGQIPIDPHIREWGDAGTPIVQAAPESAIAASFREITLRLVSRVTAQNLESADTKLEIDRSGGKNKHLPIAR
ncbi:MAG: Mrp/NBP35 family ATP-binding protein [Polyangiaceae bacterium]